MDSVGEALAFVEEVLRPERLSTVQELVFRRCWLGDSYQEIAEDAGYEADYLRSVGSRLWQQLSDIFAERVTKNNLRAVLRQQSLRWRERGQPVSNPEERPVEPYLELPEGPVPLGSSLYVERPPIEARAYETISQPGTLLRIKAPQGLGKTSLMVRCLERAGGQDCRVVKLSFQQAERAILADFDRLLRWFCASLSRQLQLDARLDDYWDEDLGSKVSSTSYLQGHVLAALDGPVVVAIDEVDLLFEHAAVAQEFLPLLRFWHEEGRNLAAWARFRWIVAHATDVYVPLNINQSPFNVGVALQLTEFSSHQVAELAKAHHLSDFDNPQAADDLVALVGGHPYLVRVALYSLSAGGMELDTLLAEATTQAGVYRNHLQGHLVALQARPELAAAFKRVLSADGPVRLETLPTFQLLALGLVSLQGNDATVRYELYRRYFGDRLEEF